MFGFLTNPKIQEAKPVSNGTPANCFSPEPAKPPSTQKVPMEEGFAARFNHLPANQRTFGGLVTRLYYLQ